MADLAWVGATAWAALYCSDYYLTLACARLYAQQDKIKFEGSYELNPLRGRSRCVEAPQPKLCRDPDRQHNGVVFSGEIHRAGNA